MKLITTPAELESMINMVSNEKIFGCDTEFCRRRTYFPRLSLLQISTREENFIIDAIAIPDISILHSIFLDAKIIKIMHAPRQDIEILFHIFGAIPKNIFDTQTAARICSMGENISYQDLCYRLLKVEIDKTYQVSDWIKRPIKDSMLEYAAADTKFLYALYVKLDAEIKKLNLYDEFYGALDKLTDQSKYSFDGVYSKKIRISSKSLSLKKRVLRLASFREYKAIELNIPRNFISQDYQLVIIAKHLPLSFSALEKININFSKIIAKNKQFKSDLIKICQEISQEEKI